MPNNPLNTLLDKALCKPGLYFLMAMCYILSMICPNNTPIVGNLQTLSIKRGTTLKLKAQRLDYNEQPILEEAEGIYFVVKKKWTDENYLFKKSIADMTFDEEGYYHFTINPTDTEYLPYGNYVWDFTATLDDDAYRAKPASGIFIVGNSSCWIINENDESES